MEAAKLYKITAWVGGAGILSFLGFFLGLFLQSGPVIVVSEYGFCAAVIAGAPLTLACVAAMIRRRMQSDPKERRIALIGLGVGLAFLALVVWFMNVLRH